MSSTRSERSDGKGRQEPCTGQPADNRKPEPPDKQPQASRENRGREGGAERKAMAGPLSEDADELVSWTAGRLVQLGLDVAEWDDVLCFTASTYDAASDRLTLGTGVPGPARGLRHYLGLA